jgi:hypothetical protein
MTKLEELKAAVEAARDGACDASAAAHAAKIAAATAWAAYDDVWDAYRAELEKRALLLNLRN